MSHYIERFIGNKASNPWWLGLPEVEGLYELADEDVKSSTLREKLFNYSVELRPVDVRILDKFGLPDHAAVEGFYTPVCSDGVIIPAVVGSKYSIIQPEVFANFGDCLAKTSEARWHTAGILSDRTRIWGLAEVGEQFKVGPEDIRRFLLFWNTFDGTSRWKVKPVTECVVCHNTAEVALREDTRDMVAIKHTGDTELKLEEAKELLGIAEERFADQVTFIEQLQADYMSRSEFRILSCQMLTGEDVPEKAVEKIVKAEGSARTVYEGKGSELMRIYDEGDGAAERGPTAWRSFNAITEFIDWQRGRMANYRRRSSRMSIQGLDSAWFGDGAAKKQRALKLITRRKS
jgi:phage/plasmid-like protein (TIGR03299 family)